MATGSAIPSSDASCGGGGEYLNGPIALESLGRQLRGGAWDYARRANLEPALGARRHGERVQASGAEAISPMGAGRRQLRDALADSDVFGALPDDALDRLIGQGRIATYPDGATVFRKGDPAEDLMIVLGGRIRLGSASRSGKEVVFDFIGPGRCFREVALLDGTARKLDATAIRASAVFVLGRRDALVCLEAHPEVSVRVIRVLCMRLSRAMAMLEDRTQLGLSPRSARTLLRLASEHGDGRHIELKISQGEIAALVGATREKVNRQLCVWCRAGILANDEGHLTILDESALRAIAEETDQFHS